MFKMTLLWYFANISVQILPNNKKVDIFKLYTEMAVEKCPRWNFWTHKKPRSSKNESGYSFARHSVAQKLSELELTQNKVNLSKGKYNKCLIHVLNHIPIKSININISNSQLKALYLGHYSYLTLSSMGSARLHGQN